MDVSWIFMDFSRPLAVNVDIGVSSMMIFHEHLRGVIDVI